MVNKLCGNGGHVGGIYSINIITMPRLNCVTPLIKDEIEGTVNLAQCVLHVRMLSSEQVVGITVIQLYDGDVII